MISVLVVDDQEMVRAGFAALVGEPDDIDVVGTAANGVEAVEQARALRPDVVLMDVRMPVMDGLDALRVVLDELPDTRVLMLTTFDLDEYVYEALSSGASGFLLKHSSPADLITAVRVVAEGAALLDPTVTRRLIEDFVRSRPMPLRDKPSDLTPRETEVLVLVARGLSNTEIAESLVVAEQTVKTHVSRIFTKLGLRDRAQAVVFAYEAGLVTPRAQG